MTHPIERASVEQARTVLIDAIISMYHTTRLSEVPASTHILSKHVVQTAFHALEQQARDAGFAEARAWQSIDSAPGDGTDVLLVDIDRPHIPPKVAGWSQGAETWMDYDGREVNFDPTHWLLIPALSAEANEGRCDG